MNEMITTELALAAAKVLHDYCNSKKKCADCAIEEYVGCFKETLPYEWNIPEKRLQRKGEME